MSDGSTSLRRRVLLEGAAAWALRKVAPHERWVNVPVLAGAAGDIAP